MHMLPSATTLYMCALMLLCSCCQLITRVIREVVDKARGKHYQLACGLAFEGITGSPQETGINKPSEFYAASIELATQRAAAGSNGGAAQQGQQQGQPAGGSSLQPQQQEGPPQTPAGQQAAATPA
jgi:hypothetical protein